MSRRARKRRPVVVTYGWNQDWADLFSLAGKSWTPPTQVRAVVGQKQATVTARFITDRGVPTKATARLRFNAAGDAEVIEEGLSVALRTRVGGKGRGQVAAPGEAGEGSA